MRFHSFVTASVCVPSWFQAGKLVKSVPVIVTLETMPSSLTRPVRPPLDRR
jgi:hypothetical protein